MVVEAIEYSRFGNEEDLDLLQIDSTALDVNQVRVEVHAVGLNPIDYKTFEGAKPLRFLSFITKLRKPSRWFESNHLYFQEVWGEIFLELLQKLEMK